MTFDPTTFGTYIAGIACAIWAGINHFRVDRQKERKEQIATVDKAHAELLSAHEALMKTTIARIETIERDRDAWRERYDELHKEFTEYRTSTHNATSKAQGIILQLTEENGQLKAKTDLTPILKFQEEQSQINARVLEGLTRIVEALAKLKNQ
jgi:hypothetical protein